MAFSLLALLIVFVAPSLSRAQKSVTSAVLIPSERATPSLQQPATKAPSEGRDDRAVGEALKGWWTASMKNHEQRIAWWRDAQFGCFIHWGVYSTFGGEWNGKRFKGHAEHMMRIQKIPRAEYSAKVVSVFNPVKFNADGFLC